MCFLQFGPLPAEVNTGIQQPFILLAGINHTKYDERKTGLTEGSLVGQQLSSMVNFQPLNPKYAPRQLKERSDAHNL